MEGVHVGYECVMAQTKSQSKPVMIPHTITDIQPLDFFSLPRNCASMMRCASSNATLPAGVIIRSTVKMLSLIVTCALNFGENEPACSRRTNTTEA